MLGDAIEPADLLLGEAIVAQLQGRDQGAMDDEIGIAADRRGEVGVTIEVETEMPVVGGGIFGLCLAAQHHLADLVDLAFRLSPRKRAVEIGELDRILPAERHVERGQEVAKRLQLLRRWRVMDAVDQGRLLLLQSLGRRDIGGDHHLLDQPVGLEALGHADVGNHAGLVEDDLALGDIEIERAAAIARLCHGLVGRPDRLEDRLEDRPGLVIGLAVDGGLGLLIAELGRRAEDHPMEAVRGLSAIRADHHADGQ